MKPQVFIFLFLTFSLSFFGMLIWTRPNHPDALSENIISFAVITILNAGFIIIFHLACKNLENKE
jgi:tryptophan-rich sensory protein